MERTWPGSSREKAISPPDWVSVMKMGMPATTRLNAPAIGWIPISSWGSFQSTT